MTAQGGSNTPTKFFLLYLLIPFFTPTPESHAERVVDGILTSLNPRWATEVANPTASSIAPPPIARTTDLRHIPNALIASSTVSTT